MKTRTIAKKSIVAILMCGSMMAVRPAKAFIWPVVDIAQVGSFVTNISTGISEVSNTKSQIENALEIINSIGDQVTTAAKYGSVLTGSGTRIGDVDFSEMVADKDIEEIAEEVSETVKDVKESDEELAEVTIENINSQIAEGANPEEIEETINAAKEESQTQAQELATLCNAAEMKITDIADNVVAQLEGVRAYLDNNTDMEESERLKYQKQVDNLIKQMENLKKTMQEMIASAQASLTTYTANVTKSFDEYAQSVQDYQNGRISEEDFRQAEEKLKQDIASNDIGLTPESITQLTMVAQEVVDACKKLQEDILNSQSNSREYSEDEPEKISSNLNIKYDFQYSSSYQGVYANQIYYNDKFLEGNVADEYDTFVLSTEFACKEVEKKEHVTELEVKNNIEIFMNCVTYAKTRKELNCPRYGVDPKSEECDPYALEKSRFGKIYKPFPKEGVYKHIVEDYSIANIQNNTRNQQYADSWMRGDGSAYETLAKQIEESRIDTTRNAYEFMGLIDLEGPKLWNKIRVVDTLHRAKKATQQFSRWNGILSDLKEAEVDVEIGTNKIKKQIFPNRFLKGCDAKVNKISVDFKKKYDTDETANAEAKIAKCMFHYAARASGAKPDNAISYCAGRTIQQCAEEWTEAERAAINDASFQTFRYSTMNTYQASTEYEENSDKVNINKLEKMAKEAKTSRDGYVAGALINYHETMQILGIVDADAQNLQTEIVTLLPEIDYNFFDESFSEE